MLDDTVASTILIEMTVQIAATAFLLKSEHEGVSEVSPFMYEHWLLTVSHQTSQLELVKCLVTVKPNTKMLLHSSSYLIFRTFPWGPHVIENFFYAQT